jgi:hypothetical protein
VIILLERALVSWSSAIDEQRFTWFRPLERNTLRPHENSFILLKSDLACVSLSLFLFFNPYEVASTRTFYNSSLGSYNEPQGPTSGPGAGKTLHGRAPMARSSI